MAGKVVPLLLEELEALVELDALVLELLDVDDCPELELAVPLELDVTLPLLELVLDAIDPLLEEAAPPVPAGSPNSESPETPPHAANTTPEPTTMPETMV